jgi:nitrogen PTS system EIIA component
LGNGEPERSPVTTATGNGLKPRALIIRRAGPEVHKLNNGTAMNIGDLLAANGIIPALKAEDKKQALYELAQRGSEISGLNAHDIFNALLQRERLSSTSLGRGIAIPHVKLSGLPAITCIFARLESPIAFESHDGDPVDLLFFLMAPDDAGGDHLKALARISRLVRDAATLEQLRTTQDVAGLHKTLTAPITSHAA